MFYVINQCLMWLWVSSHHDKSTVFIFVLLQIVILKHLNITWWLMVVKKAVILYKLRLTLDFSGKYLPIVSHCQTAFLSVFIVVVEKGLELFTGATGVYTPTSVNCLTSHYKGNKQLLLKTLSPVNTSVETGC